MTQEEAFKIAQKYADHCHKRKWCRKQNKVFTAKFHEGCAQMALQIFEENATGPNGHGFGSPKHALAYEGFLMKQLPLPGLEAL